MTTTQLFLLVLVLCTSLTIDAYNEEKPIYKWSPVVFRNLKKDAHQYNCAPERAVCGFRWSMYRMYMKLPCCDGLVCERLGSYNMCLRPAWEQNDITLY